MDIYYRYKEICESLGGPARVRQDIKPELRLGHRAQFPIATLEFGGYGISSFYYGGPSCLSMDEALYVLYSEYQEHTREALMHHLEACQSKAHLKAIVKFIGITIPTPEARDEWVKFKSKFKRFVNKYAYFSFYHTVLEYYLDYYKGGDQCLR